MTVTTVYATESAGNWYVRSADATYATARTGGTLAAFATARVGQALAVTYQCYESFLIFDTSGIPDSDTVSAVIASLDGSSDSSTTDFTAKLAASSYDGGSVETGDWVSGADLNALTVLASWSSAGYSVNYNAFSETTDFKTAVNKTGNTSLILFSDRHADGTVPTGNEYVVFTTADAAGTTTDPKLDITHFGVAITGTATASIGEADVVAGGKTIIITLTGTTWIAS